MCANLQAGFTGRHALELLAQHNRIQRYHLEVEGIPKYINMLEDAQKQAGRAGRTITDENLLLFAATTMLTTTIFPRANKDREDWAEPEKTWTTWNQAYKKEHTKVRIKAQANDGTEKFGTANSAAHQETTKNVEKKQAVDKGGMKALEGYFNNLAAAVVNKKSVLEQLVVNNTKLAATNENLVAMVKKLTGGIKNLERDNARLKKGGKSSQGPTLWHHCKKGVYHVPDACYELAKKQIQAPPWLDKPVVKAWDGQHK